MSIKIVIFFLFTLFMAFSLPTKAAVCPSNSHFISFPTPQKPGNGMTVLAIVLCVLAGAIGVHRVVMGGSPWLILAYTFTLGGFFFILPFMDFVRLLSEPEHYKNNSKFLAAFGMM